jgi:F0F1-type ATP synthase membrane subunit b/b'
MYQRERDWIGTVARIVVLLMLLAPGIALAASEGGHESGGGLISLDKSLIIQFLNFIILLLILQRLLYKPFLAKMAERTQAIQKSLDEAQAARAESQRLVETAKAQMDADVRRARDELRREVADLATAVAEKLVRRSLRDEDHRRIVAEAIAKVGN